MSLRRRILLGVLAVVVVLVASNLVLASTFEGYLMGRVDDRLAETVDRPALAGRAQGLDGRPGGDEPITDLFLAVADLDAGTLVPIGTRLRDVDPPSVDASSLTDRATRVEAPIAPFTVSSTDGDTRWRLAAVSIRPRAPRVLVVGINLADLHAALDRARLIQIAGSATVVVALAAMAWWVLRLGVGPLVQVASTADQIAAGDLTRRVERTDDRTEAGRLGQAFNTMVDEIEGAFERQRRSEERVRRFAADASHELRTPLTSIRGYAELWEAGGLRDPEQLAEAMRRLGQEAKRMGLMVDDLMLLARLDEHRPFDRRPVRLDELVADAVNDARAVDPDRPVQVAVEPAVVTGDEDALRQVIANLLTNARVHTPEGTPVSVEVSVDDRWARLTVSDTGPGMDEAAAAQVFERFFRADPSRARNQGAGGSGLGLSIVRSVAEAHGGQASVRTAPGDGFAVTVVLPRAPDA
ncbi:MAG: sensor histidine kinase [Acidimicrobiales bacterium]